MSIKKFLSKYENLAKELVRCGSCTNIILHSGGKYEIVQVEKEESVICETCKRNNRNVELVTRITSSADTNHNVFQIPISQLNINVEPEPELEE